jgi:histidyl-tRNA synthetase
VPGIALTMDGGGGGFKAQLRRADRSGARLALLVGEDELERESISVKPLRSDAPQVLLALDELVAELLRARASGLE